WLTEIKQRVYMERFWPIFERAQSNFGLQNVLQNISMGFSTTKEYSKKHSALHSGVQKLCSVIY
ncbi:MAG TPA: hypothetical protein DIW81_13960, partial [Planctomycetaceae bacterium]|nr:hypothetical protein [Planctomycetaceae bacterium]